MNISRITCLIVFLSLSAMVMGQPRGYSTTNKSAIKNYESATKLYDSYQNQKAEVELKKALEKDPRFIEAYILLANVYVDMNNYPAAIEQYLAAIDVNPNFYPTNYYTLANIELNTGKYEDAQQHYNKFLSFPGTNQAFRSQAERKIQSCRFAIEALKHPVPFNPENLGENINSKYDEYFPSITVDDEIMIYTRNRPDVEGSNHYHEDFYISHKINGKWGPSENGGNQLNTTGNEGVPNFSTDGKIVFFAACGRPDGKGSCDLYYSRLNGNVWSKPINLGSPVNTGAWESQPSFSSDGRTLYFIRGIVTGEGIHEQDIYVTKIGDDGRWTVPAKLDSKINTEGEEEFVYIHPDDQTLYFSSDGHVGMGNLDIYVSRRQPDGSWGEPQDLGYPLNTWRDERGMLVGPKGDIAYIASDREGGYGGLDLYSFELYKGARPLQVSFVKGNVIDNKTEAPLEAAYEIIDLETGKTVTKGYSDKITGDFLVTLTAGKDYGLNVSKQGYLFYSDHFSCTDPADIKNAYSLKVKLEAAEQGSKVILKNVFFDTNEFALKASSNSELDKLVAFLQSNPGVLVEISGHTDSTGDKQKNKILSENRAKTVYQYLINKGIPATSMRFAGYGDSKPVAGNDTEEGRAMNRRTEFTILSVKN
ncbi:MAG TPA: OmpA family protein [Bacteroidia bacterium]|nr:OmpA family protein [Bacteroidia bacterium]